MDSQVDEVKNKVDVVALIGEYVQLKKAGRNFKATCPFHSEKTPSFMVSPDRQIFKCFGCNEGGDAFEFLKKMEGLEFGESLRLLAGRVGVQLKEYKPSPAEKRKDTLLEISQLATNLYAYLLTKHKLGANAADYLKSRSVTKKSIENFQLGFSPRQKKFLFKFLVKKGYSPQDIIATGLAIPTREGPIDRFRGRIIFPIADVQGRVIAFSGRALPVGKVGLANPPAGGEPKYMNSPETPIFNKSKSLYGLNLAKTAIRKEKEAILVEGNLDVVSSHQVGVENVVAPLGTALTVQQVENLKKLTDRVTFAFDTDLAGDVAAKRGIEMAEEAGMNMKVVQMIEGKDPDEVIKKSPTLWKKSIKEAVPIYDYFISSSIKKYGSNTAEGKRRVAAEVLNLLARLTDEILRSHYLQQLSLKISVDEDTLREIMEKYTLKEDQSNKVREVLDKPLSPRAGNIVEKYLLALIIQSGRVEKGITPSLFSDNSYQEIIKLIKEYKKIHDRWKVKSFAKTLPVALLPTLDDVLLFDVDQEVLDLPERLEEEIASCSIRLKELVLRKKLKEISLAIKQAEAVGNDDKIRLLSEEFRDKSKALTDIGAN